MLYKQKAERKIAVVGKEPLERIIAHIYAHGDSSVGMMPFSLKVTIDGLDMKRDIEDPIDNGRKEFRSALAKFFYEWLDYGGVDVTFSDECCDCYAILDKRKKHKCPLTDI